MRLRIPNFITPYAAHFVPGSEPASFTAVLRYKDSGIALYMLLPARGTSPEQILTEESVQEMLLAKTSFELDLSIPRFTVDFSSDLRESLTHLGMGIAFQYPGANFSSLGAPPFFIGGVLHKTRLEVDEEGTVAAAETAMGMLTAPSGHNGSKEKYWCSTARLPFC
jgi:serine protease inhibitor